MLPEYINPSELVKRNGDGSGDAIVLLRSNDLPANKSSWKSFQRNCGASRRTRGKRRSPDTSLPIVPTAPSNLESPVTSVESDRSDSSPPASHRRATRSKRTRKEPQTIDLTGDSLEHARNFKRSLRMKGPVKVTLVGEDNLPLRFIISSSESEAEEPEAAPASWLLPPIFYNSGDEI